MNTPRSLKSFPASRLLSAALIFGIASSAHATCFVNASATGLNNGSSWTDAYTLLTFALIDPSCAEIRVAKGIYKPTVGSDRTLSFEVPAGTSLIGGYAPDGTGSRDAVANLTILSGDIDNNDIVDSAGVDSTAFQIVGNNSYNVLRLDGSSGPPIGPTTIIDGFTITGGAADDTSAISGNTRAGGGLYCDGTRAQCSPVLRNVLFVGNQATIGGALYLEAAGHGSANPSFSNAIFAGNVADFGGAIYSHAGNGNASPTFKNAAFIANVAGSSGGAIYSEAYPGTASPSLQNALFHANSAISGGAFFNAAAGLGTASPSISNSTFIDNSASFYGGAFYNCGGGGGNCAPVFTNVTFTANNAERGGAIDNSSASSTLRITNAILWADSATDGAEIATPLSMATIDNSVVQNGCPAGALCGGTVIAADPELSALTYNGGFTRTVMIGSGSSAMNIGNDAVSPSQDQRGQPRPYGAHSDAGAVERQGFEDEIFKDNFQGF